jgi:hypothetical protein
MISPFISPFRRGSRWFPSDRTQATDLCPREHELGSYGLPRLWAFWDDRACGTLEAGWGRLEMFPQMVDILNIYLYIYIYLFIYNIYIHIYICEPGFIYQHNINTYHIQKLEMLPVICVDIVLIYENWKRSAKLCDLAQLLKSSSMTWTARTTI